MKDSPKVDASTDNISIYNVCVGMCIFIACIGIVLSVFLFAGSISFDLFGVQTGSIYDGISLKAGMCLFLMSVALLTVGAKNENLLIVSGVFLLFGVIAFFGIAPWAWDKPLQNPWILMNLLGACLWLSALFPIVTISVFTYRLANVPVKELNT